MPRPPLRSASKQALQGRHIDFFHIDPHSNLAELSPDFKGPVQQGIEVVLKEGGAGMLQIEVRITAQVVRADDTKFLPSRHMVDDTGDMGDAELPKGIGPVATVVQYHPPFYPDHVWEVGPESNCHSCHSCDHFGGRRKVTELGRLDDR